MKLGKYGLAALLLLASLHPTAAMAAGQTKLVKLSGSVYMKKAGEFKETSAIEGMAVSQGDQIRTADDGLVTLIFGDGTETMLDANTKLLVSQLEQSKESSKTSFSLVAGKVWNKVKYLLNANDRYDVETPTTVMGVRGTLFLSEVVPGTSRSKVAVFDGVVGDKLNMFFSAGDSIREILIGVNQQLEALSLGNPLPEKVQLDVKSIIETTHPRILAQMIQDILTQVSQHVEEAKQEESKYQKSKNPEDIKLALTLAAKAEALVSVGNELIHELKSSDKSQQVDQALRENSSSLVQAAEELKNLAQAAIQTLEHVKETAQQAGFSKEQIDQAAKPPASELPANPNPTTDSSNSSSNKGSNNPPPPEAALTLSISAESKNDGTYLVNLSGKTPDDQVIVKVTGPDSQIVFYDMVSPANGQYTDSFSLLPDHSGYGTYTCTVGKGTNTLTKTFTISPPASH
jgi:hypothetical protein